MDEGTGHAEAWVKCIPGRGKSRYEGPGVSTCPVCTRSREEASVAAVA